MLQCVSLTDRVLAKLLIDLRCICLPMLLLSSHSSLNTHRVIIAGDIALLIISTFIKMRPIVNYVLLARDPVI